MLQLERFAVKKISYSVQKNCADAGNAECVSSLVPSEVQSNHMGNPEKRRIQADSTRSR